MKLTNKELWASAAKALQIAIGCQILLWVSWYWYVQCAGASLGIRI